MTLNQRKSAIWQLRKFLRDVTPLGNAAWKDGNAERGIASVKADIQTLVVGVSTMELRDYVSDCLNKQEQSAQAWCDAGAGMFGPAARDARNARKEQSEIFLLSDADVEKTYLWYREALIRELKNYGE